MSDSRVILVSGATGGIGRAVTKQLLQNGYRTSLGSRGNILDQEILDAIDSGAALHTHVDAEDENSFADWVEKSSLWGNPIFGLVNCIGSRSSYNFLDDISKLDDALTVNLKAPIYAMKYSYAHLSANEHSKIINLVSLSGQRVSGRSAGYAASKFALRALSHSVRYAGWDNNVRVTALCPGLVNTEMVSDIDSVPDDRMTQPEDIARIIHFLLELPATASISELNINCTLEPTF